MVNYLIVDILPLFHW